MNSSRQQIPSPAATGGAGTFFEQNVGAYWLAQLLVHGNPPIFTDTFVSQVSFQTNHLGWHTDDFLITCEGENGTENKLVGQVKRTFTVSAKNDDCRGAIEDFWRDYGNSDLFNPSNDCLVLVTLRGTNAFLGQFGNLLECARGARNGEEFAHRLDTEGFVSKTAIKYCNEIQAIVGEYEGRPITVAGIWPFISVLRVLSLDLDSATRQNEAEMKRLLAHTTIMGNAAEVATVSWNALLARASEAMSGAHNLRRSDLPEALRTQHRLIASEPLQALKDHTAPVLRQIRSTIGQKFHLPRAVLVQKLLDEMGTAQVILVSGPAGSGKSVVGKNAVESLSRDHIVIGFRAEEFAQPHFDNTLQAAQIPLTEETLRATLAAQDKKVILVESVERLLEKSTRDAFSGLLNLATSDPSIRIILTCRDYSTDQVRASFLQPIGIGSAVITVPPLTDEELTEIETAVPQLVHPLKSPSLREILRNPYFLDKALGISWSEKRPVPENQRDFRALFWSQIVRDDGQKLAGRPRLREKVFQEIAVRRARALSPYIPCTGLDENIVDSLRQDSLIISPDDKPLLVATAHDVLEDWAILQWIEEQYQTSEGSFEPLSDAIGGYPAIRRAYRNWVEELVGRNPSTADQLFTAALSETKVGAQFRDDTLVSLLKASLAPDLLLRHEDQLLANERSLFIQVIHLLRVACVTTPRWLVGMTDRGSIFNVPEGQAWATVAKLINRNIDHFTPQEYPLLTGMIEDSVRNVSWIEPEVDVT